MYKEHGRLYGEFRGGRRKMMRQYECTAATCAGKRKLLYLPIIHTPADMGTLGASIRGKKLSTLGRQSLTRNATVVEKMWEEIERVVACR